MATKAKLAGVLLLIGVALGYGTVAPGQTKSSPSDDKSSKAAVAAYTYFYPLVVFGVSMEALTNVERINLEKSE